MCLVALLSVLLPTTPAHAVPSQVPDATAGTNGTVYALLEVGDRVYVGGKFSWAGPYTGNGAAVSGTDGQRLASSAFPSGPVLAAAADGSGGWYVGGSFTKIGKAGRLGVARINKNGGLAGWNPSVTGTVEAIVVGSGAVYLGGSFSTVGGQARSNLAAVDPGTGAVLSFDPAPNGPVHALALSPDGSTLYAGGSFTTAGGASRSNLAAIDVTTGLSTSFDPAPNGPVHALALSPDGSTLYAGGSFTTAGGASRSNLAAIDVAMGLSTSFDPAPNGPVHALAAGSATLYAGGSFTTAGGASRSNLAAIDVATGLSTSFDPAPNGAVRSLSLSGTRLLAGGDFTSAGGASRVRVAAFDTTTGAADAFDPRADATVRALAVSGAKAYVGGDFSMLNGAPRNNVAAIDSSTGEVDLGWNANANAKVRAIAASPDGSIVYIGGSFFKVDGVPRDKVAAVSAVTGDATSWKPNASGEVRAIATSGDAVYVGGFFTQIGGENRSYLAKVSAGTGIVDPAFDAQADGGVRALDITPDGSKLYAGGDFHSIGGGSRNGAAELDPASGASTSWDPSEGGVVLDVELSPDGATLYFSTTSNRTHRFEPATSNTPTWSMHSGGDVQAIAVSPDHSIIYLGGHFGKFTTQNVDRKRIGAIYASDMTVTDWYPKMNSFYGVWAFQATDDALLVGGDFTRTGGREQRYFARFSGTP
jgi:WD40 repeat protein